MYYEAVVELPRFAQVGQIVRRLRPEEHPEFQLGSSTEVCVQDVNGQRCIMTIKNLQHFFKRVSDSDAYSFGFPQTEETPQSETKSTEV